MSHYCHVPVKFADIILDSPRRLGRVESGSLGNTIHPDVNEPKNRPRGGDSEKSTILFRNRESGRYSHFVGVLLLGLQHAGVGVELEGAEPDGVDGDLLLEKVEALLRV